MAAPPLAEHSVEEKQEPVKPLVAEHSLFLNCTMANRDSRPTRRYQLLKIFSVVAICNNAMIIRRQGNRNSINVNSAL